MPLSPSEIRELTRALPTWSRRGAVLRRTFEFADFLQAMKFVNAVARAAEKAQHHPDIDIRWNKVRLALTTHDAGGLTPKDFDLAERANRLAETLRS
jgi:4a-hydroxytetrahydrobiopterin dehydratase